jgi:hypothetical protein
VGVLLLFLIISLFKCNELIRSKPPVDEALAWFSLKVSLGRSRGEFEADKPNDRFIRCFMRGMNENTLRDDIHSYYPNYRNQCPINELGISPHETSDSVAPKNST